MWKRPLVVEVGCGLMRAPALGAPRGPLDGCPLGVCLSPRLFWATSRGKSDLLSVHLGTAAREAVRWPPSTTWPGWRGPAPGLVLRDRWPSSPKGWFLWPQNGQWSPASFSGVASTPRGLRAECRFSRPGCAPGFACLR